MNPFYTRALAVASLLLVMASLGGCGRGDECESGEYRCDGDVASNCRLQIDDAHYFFWNRSQCDAGLCRTDSVSAFCTVSATPEPSCTAGTQTACVGSSVVVCHSGYAASKVECAPTSAASNTSPALAPFHTSPQSAFCIPNGPKAFCAAEAEPNATCDTPRPSYSEGERLSAACDTNDLLSCVNGYVVSRERCDGVCLLDTGKPYCALSADPDPNCPLTDYGSQHCEGNVVVACSATGYRISEEECAETACYQMSNCPASNPACTATAAACIRKDRGGAQ